MKQRHIPHKPRRRDEFTLAITLGNDAMRTSQDIARALRRVAEVIDRSYPDHYTSSAGDHVCKAIRGDANGEQTSGTIRDANGNRVGSWSGAPLNSDDQEAP